MQVRSLGWEDPLEEEVAPHSSILAGKSHGQRSLEGYSPRVAKGRTPLKWLSTHKLLLKIHFFCLRAC